MIRLLPVAASALVVVAAGSDADGGRGTSLAGRCSVSPRLRAPPPDRPKYALGVRVDEGLRRASGTLRVSFQPEVATDRLVFRLWANVPVRAAQGARLAVTQVTVDGQGVATVQPQATTLVLRRAVGAGERV